MNVFKEFSRLDGQIIIFLIIIFKSSLQLMSFASKVLSSMKHVVAQTEFLLTCIEKS